MGIRSATEDDAEAISALARALTAKFVSHEFSPAGQRTLHEALGAGQVRFNMRNGCRYHVYEEDGVVLGLVATRADRHLLKLFVAEAAQARGLARALWETAKQACIAAGYSGPFTVSAARAAVPMYEAFGFVRSGNETTEDDIIRVPMHTPS